jgi:DNA-binding transcriptional MerR regulator
VDKAPDAFRTISEVAEEINVPQHVLRFWESRFAQIKPLKRGGGRRYYRPDDVDLLRGIRHLLYGEGYTIRGVQRILREEGLSFVQSVWRPGAVPPPEVPEEDESEAADSEPAFFDPSSATAEPGGDHRRETTLGPPTARARQNQGADGGDRRTLQRVLNELMACQQLIDAALSDPELSENGAAGASEDHR